LSLHWRHINGINIDGGALAEETDGNEQPGSWALPDQGPAQTGQWASDDLDRHPWLKSWVWVHWQNGGHKPTDRLDLFEGDRHGTTCNPNDLHDAHCHLYLPVLLSGASDEGIAGEKRELHMDTAVLPLANPIN